MLDARSEPVLTSPGLIVPRSAVRLEGAGVTSAHTRWARPGPAPRPPPEPATSHPTERESVRAGLGVSGTTRCDTAPRARFGRRTRSCGRRSRRVRIVRPGSRPGWRRTGRCGCAHRPIRPLRPGRHRAAERSTMRPPPTPRSRRPAWSQSMKATGIPPRSRLFQGPRSPRPVTGRSPGRLLAKHGRLTAPGRGTKVCVASCSERTSAPTRHAASSLQATGCGL
jgi:hypothetical protein